MHRLAILSWMAACGGTGGTVVKDDAPTTLDATPTGKLVVFASGGDTITRYEVDRATGAFGAGSPTTSFGAGTSFLAARPGGLVAVSEGDSRVGSYRVDRDGKLTFVNDKPSGGSGPAHVAVDATGSHALVANYGSGHVAVYPIDATGALGAPTATVLAGKNAHQVVVDPSNHFVFVPCLGDDRVAQYLYDADAGTLTPNAVPYFTTAQNAGPRHLAFAPNAAPFVYLIDEKASTLEALAFDVGTGRLSHLQTISTRAANATGSNTTAEVVVHPSGKWVVGSNRGDDNLVTFAIGGDGKLALVGHTPTQGQKPRSFALAPGGRFLTVANQTTGSLVTFVVDGGGQLAQTGTPIDVPAPAFVGYVELP